VKLLDELGLKVKGKMTWLWTEEEIDQLRALARKKVSAEDIAKALRRHAGSVKKKMRELGLVPLKKTKTKRK
jgi:predicted transcriptional regulator